MSAGIGELVGKGDGLFFPGLELGDGLVTVGAVFSDRKKQGTRGDSFIAGIANCDGDVDGAVDPDNIA